MDSPYRPAGRNARKRRDGRQRGSVKRGSEKRLKPMPRSIADGLARLQRLLPWSNTRRAWLERLSLAGVAAAVAALIAFGNGLALWQLVLAWAALVLTAAVLFRRDWLKLFGPILWYDLVRTSRRARTYLLRGGYLLTLLAVLSVLYLNAWPGFYGSHPLKSQIARFAQEFCCTFLTAQFVLTSLLAPAFTAGAIAEEKQKKTIQYILITDLRNHEIVLGKLGSRMAHLGLLLLAGLPVLGAVEFLGGVDPHLVLAAFAGTAVTMASAAGVGVLASVVARPSRAALFLAYGWILLYVVLCVLGEAAPYWLLPRPFNAAAPAGPLDGLIAVVEAGNPVAAVAAVFGSDPIEPALLHALGAYALFHGVVAVGTTLTASLLLRWACLREARPPAEKKAPRRSPVGDQPMLWKESHADRGRVRRWLTTLLFGLLFAFSLWILAWNVYERYLWTTASRSAGANWTVEIHFWQDFRRDLNGWVRIVGAIVACLTLVGVAIHAAQSIRLERERDTFDGLLTTPLRSEEILYGKWLGAILSVRWLLPWLALTWGLGVLGGGLNPLAVPLLALTWCVYAAAAASLGLWFSLVSRSSLRAVLYTILAGLGMSVGHWMIWLPCSCVLRSGQGLEWVFLAQGGLTPPVTLGMYLPFGYDEFFPEGLLGKFITFALCGDVLWGVFAWVAWQGTNERFQRDGGRVD